MKYSILLLLLLIINTSCASLVGTSQADRSPAELVNSNQGTATVDPSLYSHVYVISDVHGMYDQLATILKAGKVIDNNANWTAGNSLLIVTGDSIDKGSDSIGVLDLWIKLQKQSQNQKGRVIHLLGNHEAEFLANPETDDKASELMAELQSKNIPLSDLTSQTTERGQFLYNEILAAKVGNWIFSHSGFYPNMNWSDFSVKAKSLLSSQSYSDSFIAGNTSILEMKVWERGQTTLQQELSAMDANGVFGNVFGHQPDAFNIKGRSAAKVGGRMIKIDNGMPPQGGSHPGSLLEFTNPAQMNGNTYPNIIVIFPDGSSKELLPE